MPTHKVYGCTYATINDTHVRKGLAIQNIKSNTFVILDKKLNKVEGPFKHLVWCEASIGCIYFNLN